MDSLLYLLARGLVAFIQALPLRFVARLGRTGGGLAYWLDSRHRKVALRNIAMCFPNRSPAEVCDVARENFRRLGENYVSAIKTASMTPDQMRPHLSVRCPSLIGTRAERVQKAVVAIGHFGNFELYASLGHFAEGFASATTYRGLRQPSLDKLLRSLREKSKLRCFERRKEADRPEALYGAAQRLAGAAF